MNKIGIIGAMEEEITLVKELMTDITVSEIAGLTFYMGRINDTDLVVVRSGIGKVNAAMCTQILIDRFEVKSIINIGVAGAIADDLGIGDIVLSTKLIEHDFDVTAFGHKKGVIPRMDSSVFIADDKLPIIAMHTVCMTHVKHPLGNDGTSSFAGRGRPEKSRSDAERLSVETAQPRTAAAVAGYLAIIVGVYAYGIMFRKVVAIHGKVEVKLCSRLVISGAVCRIDQEPRGDGDFRAGFHIQPSHDQGRVKPPIIPANICRIVQFVAASRRINRFDKFVIPVAIFPIHRRHQQGIADIGGCVGPAGGANGGAQTRFDISMADGNKGAQLPGRTGLRRLVQRI